tara:strand:+ start:1222 stop:1416 length:195 start_codon:yes stop_codon:yes gene_type:complete
MSKNKIEITIEIEDDQADWISDNMLEYDLADESKAFRILLDYAMDEVDADTLFSPDNIRCRHCG